MSVIPKRQPSVSPNTRPRRDGVQERTQDSGHSDHRVSKLFHTVPHSSPSTGPDVETVGRTENRSVKRCVRTLRGKDDTLSYQTLDGQTECFNVHYQSTIFCLHIHIGISCYFSTKRDTCLRGYSRRRSSHNNSKYTYPPCLDCQKEDLSSSDTDETTVSTTEVRSCS